MSEVTGCRKTEVSDRTGSTVYNKSALSSIVAFLFAHVTEIKLLEIFVIHEIKQQIAKMVTHEQFYKKKSNECTYLTHPTF